MRAGFLIACAFAGAAVLGQDSKPAESRAASRPRFTARPAEWVEPRPSGVVESGETFETELGTGDATYPGLGPCKAFWFDVEAPALETTVFMHARTEAPDLDLLLHVDDVGAGGFLADDDDGGGRPTPQLVSVFRGGTTLRITVIGKSPSAAGDVDIRVVAVPETEETIRTSLLLDAKTEEIKARKATDPDGARNLAQTAIGEGGLAMPPRLTRLLDGALSRFASVAYDLGCLSEARDAWSMSMSFRELTLSADHPARCGVRESLGVALNNLGDTANARPLLESVVEAYARTRSAHDPETLNAKNNLAALLFMIEERFGARKLQESVLDGRLKTLPADHRHVLIARHNLALTLFALGELSEAKRMQEENLAACARTLPDHDLFYAQARLNLGTTLRSSGDARAAAELQEKAVASMMGALADDDAELATAREHLADTYFALGDFEASEALHARVLAARISTLPPDHDLIIRARDNIAADRSARGDLDGARILLQEVLDARVRTRGDDALETAVARSHLAENLSLQGRDWESLKLAERSVAVLSARLPAEHRDLNSARHGLGNALKSTGDLGRARTVLEQVVDVLRRTALPDDPELAAARQDLSSVLEHAGDLQGARTLREQAVDSLSRALPPDHLHLARARANLGATMRVYGDVEGARTLYSEALRAFQKTLPEHHPYLRGVRGNLADVLAELGDPLESRRLHEQSLQDALATLPADHRDVATARSGLAVQMKATGDVAGARRQEELALDSLVRTVPDDDADLAMVRANYAVTLRTLGELEASARVALSAMRSWRTTLRQFDDSGGIQSTRTVLPRILRAVSWGLNYADGADAETRRQLLEQTLLLGEARRDAHAAGRVDAALARDVAEDVAKLRSERAAAATEIVQRAREGSETEEFRAAVRRRDDAVRRLRELLAESPGAAANGELTLSNLAAALKPNEAAVEVLRYSRWRFAAVESGRSSTEGRFGAIVLRQGGMLDFVDLGSVDVLETAIEAVRAGGGRDGRGIELDDAPTRIGDSSSARRRLIDEVLRPLEARCAGATRVYVAFDDALQLLPAAALRAEAPTLPEFAPLSDLRSLVELRTAPPPSQGSLVAFGGINYDGAEAPSDRRAESAPTAGSLRAAAAIGAHGQEARKAFQFLAASKVETEAIVAQYSAVFGANSSALFHSGIGATRAAFQRAAPQARYIHLSTHGFFAPEDASGRRNEHVIDAALGFGSAYPMREVVAYWSPMALCGLAFAGANSPSDAGTGVRGILTAEEIAAMDLRRCELCVLSACDTNVGVRLAGRCIGSLQTALHKAGVRTAITSLWKVPDEATKDLMIEFYRRLWRLKEPKLKALTEAQRMIREAKDSATGKPKYGYRDWAAWVLSGDPD